MPESGPAGQSLGGGRGARFHARPPRHNRKDAGSLDCVLLARPRSTSADDRPGLPAHAGRRNTVAVGVASLISITWTATRAERTSGTTSFGGAGRPIRAQL